MSIYITTEKPLNETKDLLRKYGTGVEIQTFVDPRILDNSDNFGNIMDDVLECISNTKRRSMHAPFWGINPAHLDNKIRDVYRERFLQGFAIAKKLNVKNMVFHTGNQFSFKPKADKVKTFGEFWDDFLQDGKANGIEMHFENVFEKRWEYLKEYIDIVDRGNVSVCLDLGHINAYSGQDVETWIKGFKDKIKYVHLHNNYGDDDNHYGLKRGTLDMYRALSLLKEYSGDAIWVLETSEVEESIDWLIEHKLCEISCFG